MPHRLQNLNWIRETVSWLSIGGIGVEDTKKLYFISDPTYIENVFELVSFLILILITGI